MFFEDFLISAIIGGLGVAILTGIMGSFVLWKKMSYFGDSLSHASLLGIVISLVMHIDITIGALVVGLVFTITIVLLKTRYSIDTILGILAHSCISFAIIIVSYVGNINIDLVGYLFGDILTITDSDIFIIATIVVLVILWITLNWQKALLMCIDKNIAKSQGINTNIHDFIFALLLSTAIIVSIKIVGILLITALLIIPAATAKNFASTPLSMVIIATFIGMLSVITGLSGSIIVDVPSGPAIILSSLLMFIISLVSRKKI